MLDLENAVIFHHTSAVEYVLAVAVRHDEAQRSEGYAAATRRRAFTPHRTTSYNDRLSQ
jgi:hypothetical protein